MRPGSTRWAARGLVALLLASATALPGLAAGTDLAWTDHAGDGHVSSETTGPIELLSHSAWDVVTAAMSSDGNTLTWTTGVAELRHAFPPFVDGVMFGYSFRFEDIRFSLDTVLHGEHLDQPRFRWRSDSPAPATLTELPCPDCTARLDLRKSTVTLRLSVETLRVGIRRAVNGASVGRGTELGGPEVAAGPRYDVLLTKLFPGADVAPAPRSFRL